eukprot:TRINITY_DN43479_c0_g1_i1.p1 TRINITY_DN43479_c0_g1~~TRINITY_DN43479_c0_g1_i1.p1  ORF type:complete len:199 (-),score=15.34 TRINITY_DN43479_c0_g1_i1:456-1052(-)
MTKQLDSLDSAGVHDEYLHQELRVIETELKDWFLSRKVALAKNAGMEETLRENNTVGLRAVAGKMTVTARAIWQDLVMGKPELEPALSVHARELKADMYMRIYKDSTTVEHPCRVPGVEYLRCLQESYRDDEQLRRKRCLKPFTVFSGCRSALHMQQNASIERSLQRQDIADRRAKALFDRRVQLLDRLSGPGVTAAS